MKIKRTPADNWFSKCVRERADYCCERCGKKYDKSSTGLHCSHNFSRSNRTVRWCGDNAMALCYSCHGWYGGNPADSAAWLNKKLGAGVIDNLREKINSGNKVTKEEEKQIAKHYRAEFNDMNKMRKQGVIGRIEFISWQ